MDQKKRVIILTDGDHTAYEALKEACHELGCHPLASSAGNPTPLTGEDLLDAVRNANREPVVVMVDDRGDAGTGAGERALDVLLDAPDLNVLGVVAVAANTRHVQGVTVDESVTQEAEVVSGAVDKAGRETDSSRLRGDTVDTLAGYQGPVVGLGDPGKMQGRDSIHRGVPATRRAIEEILKKAGAVHG